MSLRNLSLSGLVSSLHSLSPIALMLVGGASFSCLQAQPGEGQDPSETATGETEDPLVAGNNSTLRARERAAATHCTQAELLAAADRFDEAFECGDNHFATEFNAIDGVGARVGNGQRFSRVPRADKIGAGEWFNHTPARATGPNAQACRHCHSQPAEDGAGPAANNVHRDPIRAGLIHLMIQRNTPSVFGLGALQRLAEEMTADIKADAAAGRALESKGVSFGTASSLVGVDKDLVVKPFQWKGSVAFIRDFARGAFHNELGMQAVEITGDNVDGDGDGVANEIGIGDVTAMTIYQAGQPRPTTKIELNRLGLLEPRLTSTQISQITAGESVFNRSSLGCVTCHKPSLTINSPIFSEPSQSAFFRDATFPAGQSPASKGVTPSNPIRFDLTRDLPDNPVPVGSSTLGNFERNSSGGAIVRLFGDLKRHFMGGQIVAAGLTTGLAEQISETEPGVFSGNGPATFMTENLWGVGSTAPYMHDGRSTTLTEAILEHGGEATNARNAFIALGSTDAANLLAFLNNLVLFKQPEAEEAPAQ
jgi:Di-haem oxidoreductase, putative peroxidase